MVASDDVAQVFETFRVFVIRPDKHALFTGRDSKWTDSSHDVGNDLARFEQRRDALVLGAKFGVPVDLGVVKFEETSSFANFDEHIIGSSENFVRECSEFALRANIVNLVDDCADGRVLVDDNLCNDVFIREIL